MPETDQRIVPEIPVDEREELDEQAGQESRAFADADYAKEAQAKEHQRKEGVKGAIHKGAMTLIWLAIGIIAVMLLTWAYHFVTPDCMHYLEAEQRDKLENVLFSAALASIVSGYVKKMLR